MIVAIVPVYAALFGLLFIVLSTRVVQLRRRAKVSVGDGGNPALQRAIAVHNNFAQYVPLALLLLTFCEMQKAPMLMIHLLCLVLLISRVFHAYGVSQTQENYRFRAITVLLTFCVIGLSALFLLAVGLIQLTW